MRPVHLLAASLLPLLVAAARSQNTIRMMPLGDSITEGTTGDLTYRHPLWHALRNAGYCVDFVGTRRGVRTGSPKLTDFDQDHEGHWGWEADEVAKQVRGWARTARPDVVLMHLGTNDIAGNWSVDSTIADLGRVIDELRVANPDVTVVVAKLIPVSRRKTYSVDRLNSKIPAFVASKNTARSPVVLADHTVGFDPERDTYDGLHPNETGYRKMAAVWFTALAGVLTKCPATFESFGSGCRSSAGVPALRAVSKPLVGTRFTVELSGLPTRTGTIAFGMFGASDRFWTTVPLPADLTLFRMPGCKMLVSPDIVIGMLPTAGRVAWAFGLPNTPELLNVRFFLQGGVLDAAANPFGMAWSNGGRVTIGAR